jgi:hypothetical protein
MMEEAGLVVIGFILQMLLCRLEDEKAVDCKQMHPQRVATRTDCEMMSANILATFPSVQPEQLGLPKGTRLQIHLRCRALYGDREA